MSVYEQEDQAELSIQNVLEEINKGFKTSTQDDKVCEGEREHVRESARERERARASERSAQHDISSPVPPPPSLCLSFSVCLPASPTLPI